METDRIKKRPARCSCGMVKAHQLRTAAGQAVLASSRVPKLCLKVDLPRGRSDGGSAASLRPDRSSVRVPLGAIHHLPQVVGELFHEQNGTPGFGRDRNNWTDLYLGFI